MLGGKEGQHHQQQLEGGGNALVALVPLMSATPNADPTPESPSIMSSEINRREDFAAARVDDDDDGYKSSAEQTPRHGRTGGGHGVDDSSISSIHSQGKGFGPLQADRKGADEDDDDDEDEDEDDGKKKKSKKRSGISTSVDRKERWASGMMATNLSDDDDEDDVSTDVAKNGDMHAVPKDFHGAKNKTTSPAGEVVSLRGALSHPERWHPGGSMKDLSSSREELGGGCLCADHHPLPMYNSDGFVEPSGQEQEQEERQQQQQPVVKKRNKKWARLVFSNCDEGGSGGRGEVRRRRALNSHPTTASGLLGASGSGATTVRVDSAKDTPAGGVGSIGGHHLTILEDGVFMKESCSHREERFYEMLKPVQEYVWRHPELLETFYPLSSSSSSSDRSGDDAEDCGGRQRGHGKEGEEGKKSERHHSAPAQWNWWQQRRRSCDATRDGDGGRPGGPPGAGGGSPREEDTAAAVCEGRHWDVLIPLVPFVPRYIGLRRVLVETDGFSGRKGEWLPSSAGAQDGTLMHRGPGTLATSRADERRKGDGTVRQMIVLEDLCKGFMHPCILDIKMGSRQYGMNPSEAKLRSKERKARLSTSMQYGVRLAGMKRWCPDTQQYETRSKIAGRHLTLEELRETISRFTQCSERLRYNFRKQVRRLRCAFMNQNVFRFFTSSLLFVYDADRPLLSSRVVMVDFAFTYEREELQRGGDPEATYDRDFGYIKALDTMLAILA